MCRPLTSALTELAKSNNWQRKRSHRCAALVELLEASKQTLDWLDGRRFFAVETECARRLRWLNFAEESERSSRLRFRGVGKERGCRALN